MDAVIVEFATADFGYRSRGAYVVVVVAVVDAVTIFVAN